MWPRCAHLQLVRCAREAALLLLPRQAGAAGKGLVKLHLDLQWIEGKQGGAVVDSQAEANSNLEWQAQVDPALQKRGLVWRHGQE